MSVKQLLDLSGKVAFITGGGSGIGAGIVTTLASHGAKVAICGRTQAKLDGIVDKVISNGGEAIGIPADVGCRWRKRQFMITSPSSHL